MQSLLFRMDKLKVNGEVDTRRGKKLVPGDTFEFDGTIVESRIMVIEKLNLCNYRNYETLDLNVDSKTNILYGDNAQGKTNILEAIYICSTTKSHRGEER